jgi:hypothetical protein
MVDLTNTVLLAKFLTEFMAKKRGSNLIYLESTGLPIELQRISVNCSDSCPCTA